jgi:predicted MFS family arabinose efflux permease
MTASVPREAERPAWSVAVGVGVAQTIAWGVLYYTIAALGAPMATAAAVAAPTVYAAFTVSLFVAGFLAPWAGRTVDRHGGRLVLSLGSAAGAAGMAVLAIASSAPLLFVGWCLNGVAMALGLYDVAFAAIYHARRDDARRVLTGVTLLAGLASTIFWPLSQHLEQALGLRTTLALFAGLLAVTIPIYRATLPRARGGHPARRPTAAPPSATARRTVLLLSAVFATTGFATGALSAHLLGTLRALDVPGGQIAWIASLVGVFQVAGRVLELSAGARLSPLATGAISLTTLGASFLLLLATGAAPGLAWVFAISYGMSNGVLTIARATVPALLLGSDRIGSVLGNLARPSVVTRALAPWAFAAIVHAAGTTVALGVIAAAAVAGALLFVPLMPRPGRARRGPSGSPR